MKVLALNVMRDAGLDFNCVSQALEDSEGAGLKPGHLAVVLIPDTADDELVATALEEIAEDLRGLGVHKLYDAAA
jgi:hypothetical protein